ncbi:DUF3489 domain-containing protein [Elioraea sp.]|uniref:DUF3489 domain-containing protein n=1 Tax=Elioraea sp. TaxID=2185103 RepID=UPI0025B8E10D|nr:DUF3489 domain-containing protein [Elioraea sp.]
MKLSDTQLVILSAAAKHEAGLARAPKRLPAAARNAVFRSLIKNNLLTEINAQPEHVGLGWRQDEDGTWIVARITDEGLRAIGIDPNEGDVAADTARTDAEEQPLQQEDARASEANQDAPQGDDAAEPEDDRLRHERLGVDPALIDGPDDQSYQPIEQALICAIGTITAHAADQPAWSRFCADHADLVAQLRTAAARKPPRSPREPSAPRKPREGTKQETVLALLRRDEGATIAQIIETTGWQSHTVRGFLAGLKRKGITVEVLERIRQVGPNKDGAKGSHSIYRIAG